jgi:hypothetical protein
MQHTSWLASVRFDRITRKRRRRPYVSQCQDGKLRVRLKLRKHHRFKHECIAATSDTDVELLVRRIAYLDV